MSQSEQVRLNIQGGIATLSIHRPEAKNALSREIVDRIDVLLDQAAADPGIKLLTVRSQGDFAAGADIRQMVDCTPEQAKAFVFTDTFQKLAAQGSLTLIAYKQNRTFRPPEIMLQVVAYTARVAHAGGGDDHLRRRVFVQGLGLLAALRQAQVREAEHIGSLSDKPHGIMIHVAPKVAVEN